MSRFAVFHQKIEIIDKSMQISNMSFSNMRMKMSNLQTSHQKEKKITPGDEK
jgi:hypothetical protein